MRVFQPRRGGFTLVELLVAVGIILVLAGLALLVANSGVIGNARTSSGSDRIAGWLMQARAKAQRDGAPRGIRLIPDGNGFVREAQLIEVPEPYTMPIANKLMIEHVQGGAKRAFIVGLNAADVLANVAIGDTLSIPAAGTIHRIDAPGPTTVAGGITIGTVNYPAVQIPVVNSNLLPSLEAAALTAPPAVPTPTYSVSTFGFIRQPRPTFGEPPLLLPDSVAICLNTNNSIDPLNATPSLSLIQPTTLNGQTTYDIVFSPSGEVQNTGGLGRVILWTANPEALGVNTPIAGGPRAGGDNRTVYEQSGEMRLIVVYSKTGTVAVQPVAMPPFGAGTGPYDTTKDGIGSGL